MMSHRHFTGPQNFALVACPRREKREKSRWPLKKILGVLLGSLLIGWLLSGCAMADAGGGIKHPAPGSEQMARWKPAAGVALIVVSALGLVWGVRWVRENERFYDEVRERHLAAKREKLRTRRQFWEDRFRPHEVPSFAEDTESDPLALPAKGLDAAELINVHGALALRLCEARDFVRKAQKDLSVEDYGARLAAAEFSLGEAIACIGGLIERGMRATAKEGSAKA